MNVISFLKYRLEKSPSKTAIVDGERSLTFRELYDEVVKFSSSLGFVNKDVISLISENSISFIVSYLGIINSGKIAHLISPEISATSLITQLRSADPGIIIGSRAIKDNLLKNTSIKTQFFEFNEILSSSNQQQDNFKTNDFAYLIYTSGTTSEPKGVAITHSMMEFTTKNIVRVLGHTNSDIDVLPLPLYHSFGLGCFHTSLYVGSTLVLLKNANSLENILESIKKYKATTLAAIPATLTKLLKFERNILKDYFSNVRLIITNSTSIPLNTIQTFKEILQNGNLATYYGLTEASRSTFMIFDKTSGREGSVGKPAPNVEIKIVSDNNSREGEIWIRGKNVIKNYWHNPKADKSIVDGWLRTGDIGYLDDENYLFLLGRSDDIINVGGEKVVPHEIEEIVKQIPGIEDVVAFGVDHEIFGQTVKLNVVKSKNSNLDKSAILSYCIKNLEKFKIPTKIDFVESIPKTDYGKVKRFMLK
ncbi:MAG: class I adenylate-forming enzyme family protein [Candidatus Nitrosotenuis sp.]|jgi:long-chain acyl-CoA synthetase